MGSLILLNFSDSRVLTMGSNEGDVQCLKFY